MRERKAIGTKRTSTQSLGDKCRSAQSGEAAPAKVAVDHGNVMPCRLLLFLR